MPLSCDVGPKFVRTPATTLRPAACPLPRPQWDPPAEAAQTASQALPSGQALCPVPPALAAFPAGPHAASFHPGSLVPQQTHPHCPSFHLLPRAHVSHVSPCHHQILQPRGAESHTGASQCWRARRFCGGSACPPKPSVRLSVLVGRPGTLLCWSRWAGEVHGWV